MLEAQAQMDTEMRRRLVERYRELDGRALRRVADTGLCWLRTNQQLVNSLNVFPVPDGDTGTNMVLTMQAAMDETEGVSDRSIGDIAHAIAHGALMGARGNSGVILSQLWRGFARALDGQEMMDVKTLAKALDEARETAYKGVVRPVEGTILTVSKDIALAAQAAIDDGVQSAFEMLERIVNAADESVERTPELLPVLKEAGVVDSGGMGLFFLFEGILRAISRLPLDQPLTAVQPLSALNLDRASEAIEPGQDWEVIVDFRPKAPLQVNEFYEELDQMGTSIQVGEGEGLYRMHIHVPDELRFKPIEYIDELGTITNVSIENLMEQMTYQTTQQQMQNIPLEPVGPGQIAVVAVAPGLGIARVFASLGAAALVEGGQTMNPSTEEILHSFENLPTDKVIILPNNKNIIMAAKQATELTVKNVAVIPSVSIPQGICAMFALDREGSFENAVEAMNSSLNDIQSAELTIATRTVEIDDVQVQQGQVICLLDGHLACAGDDIEKVLMETLKKANVEQSELITLYYGADLTSMQADQFADNLRQRWPEQEVEVIEGGQHHYHLIVSIE
ncbi:MAG: DAK2 domain-containing protein [Anaerolineaceae bacterium]|nr:MAG: DAK2 domain-containing protein [Anaerolineaceae bacterium]